MNRTKRGAAYRFGLLAESWVAWALRLRGYRILARRYRTPAGEIDLVVRRGRVVAFVEVKARQDLDAALESLTPRMRRRIGRAALFFVARHAGLADCTLRFDLAAVAPPLRWAYLDNAWTLPPDMV